MEAAITCSIARAALGAIGPLGPSRADISTSDSSFLPDVRSTVTTSDAHVASRSCALSAGDTEVSPLPSASSAASVYSNHIVIA